MEFERAAGSDATIDRESKKVRVPFVLRDRPPVSPTGDYFDYVAQLAEEWCAQNARTYVLNGTMLYLNSIQVMEVHYGMKYEIGVDYGPQDKQSGSYQITYDGSGGMTNVTTGTVIGKFGDDAPADLDDVPNTIGVQGDDVRGVDIPTQAGKMTVNYRHPKAFLNRAYADKVMELIGFVNNATFLGFAAGEVRLRDPVFTESDAEASAGYVFEISKNRSNFTVAGITITEKKGWDVLDPIYADDDKDGKPVKKVLYFKTVRPAGREWKDFSGTFGWG